MAWDEGRDVADGFRRDHPRAPLPGGCWEQRPRYGRDAGVHPHGAEVTARFLFETGKKVTKGWRGVEVGVQVDS